MERFSAKTNFADFTNALTKKVLILLPYRYRDMRFAVWD